jgi:hypothetical protein
LIDPGSDPGPWWKRVGWLLLIWGASVGVIGIVAWFIRLWIV